MVIDSETGQTPLSAAQRMDLHDRKMGVEPIRSARTAAAPENPPPAPAAPRAANRPVASAAAERHRQQPGGDKPTGQPPTVRIPPQPTARSQTGGRKTIVTAKWWDAKGPRTIELGQQGQGELTGGFMMLFFGTLIAAIIMAFVEPLILFVAVFALFRFGGHVIGPIGAQIVDKALAEKG